MSDRTETKDRAASRPGGANAPTRADRDPTNPTGAKVEGVDPARQGASQDLQPLKIGGKTEPLSAAAPAVAQHIRDNNLQVVAVNSESQDDQLEQLTRDNNIPVSEIKDGDRRRPRRDTLPQTRQWASEIPANPNDLLRTGHGASDAVSD